MGSVALVELRSFGLTLWHVSSVAACFSPSGSHWLVLALWLWLSVLCCAALAGSRSVAFAGSPSVTFAGSRSVTFAASRSVLLTLLFTPVLRGSALV
jgi:hypothetical protein